MTLPPKSHTVVTRSILVFVLLSLASSVDAEKIWTNSVSGLWSDGANWTGHTPPDITSFIEITNDLSKVVTIDSNTAAANLTVQKLTLGAPPGATNTLLLSGAGTNNPLIFQTGLELVDGANLRITNSALAVQLTNDHVNLDGVLTLDSGFIDFGDMSVTSRVGRVTSGVLTVNGGSFSAGTMTVGGLTNSSGTVNLTGGTLQVGGVLSLGRNLSTVGSMFMSGGQLNVPNDDTRIGDEGVGQWILTNSTASLTNLQVGRDGAGTLTLGQGGVIQVLSDVSIARFLGSTGMLAVTGGQFLADGLKIYAGRGGSGQFTLSSGVVRAAGVIVAGDSTNSVGAVGGLTVSGGSLTLSSNLWVGGTSPSTAQVSLANGSIVITNPASSAILSIPNGTLTLNGGALTADNVFVTNAAGQFSFSSGTLSTRGTTVANGNPFVVGDGINPATLHLNGGTHTFVGGLVISSNATLEGCGNIVGSIINHGTIATNCGGTIIPPSITSQPQSQTVAQGSTVTLAVTASGTQPLSYQWQLAGTNLAGATASSYTIASAQPGNSGSYDVIVTNAAGKATSSGAVLTVVSPPAISFPPQSQTILAGTTLTLTVAASGTQPLSYQWQLAGTNIPGATSSSYSKVSAQAVDGGTYDVVVTNAAGQVTSAPAVVVVMMPPTISVQPANQSVAQGAPFSFGVSASGSQPLSYQWRLNGTNLLNATASSYSKASAQLADAGTYSVIVTNSAGSVTSAPATLQVLTGTSLKFVGRTGTTNRLSFDSVLGFTYTLQYKNALSDPAWTGAASSTNGTGATITLFDLTATGSTRFYRLSIQ